MQAYSTMIFCNLSLGRSIELLSQQQMLLGYPKPLLDLSVQYAKLYSTARVSRGTANPQ
jgi:hypothetical protein